MKPRKSTYDSELRKIAVATANGFNLLAVDQILYLESDNNYTIFYLCNNSKFIATKNLGYFEQKLQNYHFVRIHHSLLVNFNKVTQYIKGNGGQLILINNKAIPVSRSRKQNLLQHIKEIC